MKEIVLKLASEQEKDMAASLMAKSEPWITLGRTEEMCRYICHDPEFLLYFAQYNEMPVGIILLDPRGVAGSPYIKSIAVYPEFRGQGIGTRLLSFAENLFKDKSRHIFICVSSFNHRARKLYEQRGYKVIGELKDYIIEGASEILMHKGL